MSIDKKDYPCLTIAEIAALSGKSQMQVGRWIKDEKAPQGLIISGKGTRKDPFLIDTALLVDHLYHIGKLPFRQ